MPSIDVKLQTHLRSYQRLLMAECERLKTLAHVLDQGQRKAVLTRLKSLRLATRDLEKVLEKAALPEKPAARAADPVPAPAPAPAPASASATAPAPAPAS